MTVNGTSPTRRAPAASAPPREDRADRERGEGPGGDRRRRQRRDREREHGRDAARHHDHVGAVRHRPGRQRLARVHGVRGGRVVPVQPRRHGVRVLHVTAGLHGPRLRRAQLPGPRDRRGRQRRSDPGDGDVVGDGRAEGRDPDRGQPEPPDPDHGLQRRRALEVRQPDRRDVRLLRPARRALHVERPHPRDVRHRQGRRDRPGHEDVPLEDRGLQRRLVPVARTTRSSCRTATSPSRPRGTRAAGSPSTTARPVPSSGSSSSTTRTSWSTSRRASARTPRSRRS